MPSHLFVISFIRIVQMSLALFLLFKCYRLHVDHSLTIACPGASKEYRDTTKYSVEWPFIYVNVPVPMGCGENETDVRVVESHWSGFGYSSYMFHSAVGLAIVYGLSAITFYTTRYEDYELNKKFPAIDLLASLSMGVLWAATCYMSWNEYQTLKLETGPEQMTQKLSICSGRAFCSSDTSGTWSDVNTYLFLGLANAMSWGISVWFIFVESGLCPDDDEDEWLDNFDVESEALKNANLKGDGSFIPFAQMENKEFEKRYSIDFGHEFGLDGAQLQRKQELLQQQEQQLVGYIRSKHQQFNDSAFDDKYAAFAPVVPTVSSDIDKAADKSIKVHSKFNLFKA